MHKNIPSVITPTSLGQIINLLKTYEASREDTRRPRPDSYLPDWRGGSGMRRRTRMFLTGCLVTLTLAGCASTPPTRNAFHKGANLRRVTEWTQSDEPG